MNTALLFIIVGIIFLAWVSYDRRRRNSTGLSKTNIKTKKSYVLKNEPAELVQMEEPTSRLFTYRDERNAFKARQPLWIRYADKTGHVTERVVEIYHPADDEVLFTWCRMKQEPRTFARRNIQSWQLLPERFTYDPIVAQYWEEEGTLDISEKLPWRRWLRGQPEDITNRYQ